MLLLCTIIICQESIDKTKCGPIIRMREKQSGGTTIPMISVTLLNLYNMYSIKKELNYYRPSLRKEPVG